MEPVRLPAVAGRFYPGTATKIADDLGRLFGSSPVTTRSAVAVMCPHAGWVYSGALAARTLAAVEVPPLVVVMCPNHTGRGARIAVVDRGIWRLPSGDVPIDTPLATAILAEAHALRGCRADAEAHASEHAIEVLVPLLQRRQPALRLVPIVVGGVGEAECVALGQALARAIRGAAASTITPHQPVLVVASSDMSHYLPDDECRRRDRLALDALITGDPAALYRAVDTHDVSMCGVLPATTMLAYAKAAEAGAPELIGYATSGEAFGDYDRVVGYAGVVVPS